MPSDDSNPSESFEPTINGAASRWIFVGMLGLVIAGGIAYSLLKKAAPPLPPEVAADPLLLQGRSIYLTRCATCHGQEGRGDGPIAGMLLGPPVGNISDGKWKHGGKPDEVLGVISRGVPNTRMAGWGLALEPPQLRAVAGYVFYLARQPVPDVFRNPD